MFQQTIQEYLDEHHQRWAISETASESSIYLISELGYAVFKPIFIYTVSQTIKYYTDDTGIIRSQDYSEQTLLQQVTKIINSYIADQ